jgi:hypothetical protein
MQDDKDRVADRDARWKRVAEIFPNREHSVLRRRDQIEGFVFRAFGRRNQQTINPVNRHSRNPQITFSQ